MTNSYKESGVDIDSAADLVKEIKYMTDGGLHSSNVISGIGGFAGLFSINNSKYKNPVLVSSTDGVGTKILVAIESGIYNTIGIDLVAMCVNDIICHGAKPLFFLDYFAIGKLNVQIATEVIKGIVDACNKISIPLIGGETAEMPGLYNKLDFDLAGFVVGIVERDEILPKKNITSGDVVFGLKSSGIHSNGFSLIRKIFNERGINYNDNSIFYGKKWCDILLEPTIIYDSVLNQIACIKVLAHVTGGGITENFVPRVLPMSTKFEMTYCESDWPEIFKWIKDEGKISYEEMLKTFNCGIGMVLVTGKEDSNLILEYFKEDAIIIGKIV